MGASGHIVKQILYINLGVLVQKYFFQNGPGGHLGFGPLRKKMQFFFIDTSFLYIDHEYSDYDIILTFRKHVTIKIQDGHHPLD